MTKKIGGDHAIDDIEVEPAVVVEVAKLAGPTPAGGVHAAARRLVAPATRIRYLQHIGHDLRVVGAVRLFQLADHRQPGG
jgi:hypothetical protein